MLTANSVITHAVGKPLTMNSTMAGEITQDPNMGGNVAGFAPNVIWSHRGIQGQVTNSSLYIGVGRGASRGVYIPAIQGFVACGRVTGGAHFAYSDQFGGCDFDILRDPAGTLVCCHVYSSDACRQAIAALPPGWTHIYKWRSGPYIQLWGYDSINCLAVVRGTRLQICALRIARSTAAPIVREVRLSAEMQI